MENKKKDFMDKANDFFRALEDAGISLSNEDGETAVVCNDCVVVISKAGDEIGANFINRIGKLNYTVGYTEEDVEEFMTLDALMGGAESE